MSDGPSVVGIAALIGDHARASMLTALMGGQALTATELAVEADITKQTASSHLAKLLDAGLVSVQAQGRHRYFQLAAPDVATLLESLMGVAHRTRAARARPGPRDPALRKARVCYDHLAGELAVEFYDAVVRNRLVSLGRNADNADSISLTRKGIGFFNDIGIATEGFGQSRRPVCRPCLDWSVRRHHLAGMLGKAVLDHCYAKRWARREEGTRVVRFSPQGEHSFRALLADAGP
jgi:DNA-binding transcriptional ArsR family regulator